MTGGFSLVQDAVGNRVTLLKRDGSMQRVALLFGDIAPLPLATFRALRAVLPPDTWWKMYGVWLAETGASSSKSALEEEQWRILTGLVGAWARDPGCIDLPRRAVVRGAHFLSNSTKSYTTIVSDKTLYHLDRIFF